MKKLITLILIIGLVSCGKENNPKEIKISAIELQAKYGITLPDVNYGEDETASPNSNNRGKKKAAEVTVSLWLNDLTISVADGIATCTVSPNAKWAGVQHWDNPSSIDGAYAIWGCERYYWQPPGPGTVTTCPYSAGGFLRGWSYDHVTGDVHVSVFLSV